MNKFFDPDAYPFEVVGFIERLLDARTNKALGTRTLEEPTRPLGSDGYVEYDISEPTVLRAGHRTFTLKASKEKPVRVVGMIEVICGKAKTTWKGKQ